LLKNSVSFLLLGGAAPGPQHARFWHDGVDRFTAVLLQMKSFFNNNVLTVGNGTGSPLPFSVTIE